MLFVLIQPWWLGSSAHQFLSELQSSDQWIESRRRSRNNSSKTSGVVYQDRFGWLDINEIFFDWSRLLDLDVGSCKGFRPWALDRSAKIDVHCMFCTNLSAMCCKANRWINIYQIAIKAIWSHQIKKKIICIIYYLFFFAWRWKLVRLY